MRAGKYNEETERQIATTFDVSTRAVRYWHREILDRWQAEAEVLGASGQTADILARIRKDADDAKADKQHGAVTASRKLEAQILCLGQFQPPPSTVVHEFKTDPTVPPTRAELIDDCLALPADVLFEAAARKRGEG